MALNWAMIDADGSRPVPLPEEKIWLAVEKCQMSLEFKDQKAKWEAKGTAYVTNQRVVFLRQPMLPAPANDNKPSEHLRSLNVPLTHLVDCRYMIPVFAAPYYEAAVLPVPGGNLPEGLGVKGILKIWFLEGGGAAFKDAVEEVRNLAKGGQHGEQLPAYQPRLAGLQAPRAPDSLAPSVAATADSSLGGRTVGGGESSSAGTAHGPSSSILASTSRAQSRAASQLAPEDLEAAKVALQQEEAEREAIRERAERYDTAPGLEHSQRDGDNDLPPAYGAATSPVTTFVPSSSSAAGNHQVSAGSCSGGTRAKEAVLLLLRTAEGRDRALQLVHGLALLTHRSFGSVRRPRFWGLWPVPHILFLLFPRSIRRETLRRIYIGGEAAENVRKILLLTRWLAAVGVAAASGFSSMDSSTTTTTTTSKEDGEVKARRHWQGGPDGFNELEVEALQEPAPRHQRLEMAAEYLAVCGEAFDVAAFLGGSSVVWRIARAGYAERGHRALRARQRRGLERIALSFELIALLLQLYTLSAARKRCRKALGRIHRQTLLLTDKLADAQAARASSSSQAFVTSSPHLSHLRPRPPPTTSSPPSPIESTLISLDAAESTFQRVRHTMSQMALEMRVATCEALFAGAELLVPHREKEGLEAWTALIAGAVGMLKAAREG